MGQAQAVQNDGDTEYRLRKAERLQLIKREAENMGAEIVKVWNAERRDDFLWFDPDKLVVVTDEKSDLYDARALEAPDEALVQSIMADGVLEPIGVRVNGKLENGTPNVEVVFGRRRVIAAREVNRRNKETGREPIRVPGLRKKNEAGNLLGVMISENEIRKGDSLLAKARKLQRYLDTGKSEIEAAVRFGVTRPTITNLLQLLELHPDVQKKIDVEGYPVAAAKELRDLPQEEQPAALDKLIEGGFLKGKSAVEAAKNLRRNGGPC